MKNILIGLAAAASLVLTGCGGGTCDNLKDASDSLADSAKACSSGTPTDEEDFDDEACEKALESCSDDDKDKLDAFADCLKDVDDCKAGQEQAYAAALVACFSKVNGLSSACGAVSLE